MPEQIYLDSLKLILTHNQAQKRKTSRGSYTSYYSKQIENSLRESNTQVKKRIVQQDNSTNFLQGKGLNFKTPMLTEKGK